MGKYLSREYTKVQADQLETILCQNPQLEVLAADLRKLWYTKKTSIPRWKIEASWAELDALIERHEVELLSKS
ncbi:MAG: hypothetical protein JJU41_12410 [Bacteroidetes bacterium]|nr:hypothetical protein [Bacteroidota bacterium]